MSKTLYLIRHCQSTGQEPDAPLTAEGQRQAIALVDWLGSASIEQIVSSPFTRAYQSIVPLADYLGLSIKTDERLIEQTLCAIPLDDWREQLAESFIQLDHCLEGGESSRTAMIRGVAAINAALQHPATTTAIATHGKLLTLILKHFDDRFGYAEWADLRNPDVYRLQFLTEEPIIKRLDCQQQETFLLN